MKKIKIVLMAAAVAVMAVLTGCSSCRHNQPTEVNTYDFEKCYKADYQYMVDNYGDSAFAMYFAEAHFDTNVTSVNPDSMIVKEVLVLFQLIDKDTCLLFKHHEGLYDMNSVEIETIEGRWMECAPIHVDDTMMMSLNCAVRHIQAWDGIVPNSNVCVLRVPIYPPFPIEAYYIFGTPESFVVMNSHTGLIIDSSEALDTQMIL